MKHDRAQPSAVSGWWANPQSPGAIGVLQLSGEAEAIEHCLQGIAHTVPAVGQARVAWFGEASDIDEGVVARPTATAALLMPHGGPRIRQLLSEAAASAGVSITNLPDTISAWPEAKTELESRMLDMLAKTESPRAVALLLAQPARFAAARTAGLVFDEQDHQRAEQLRALLHPPRLAIVGAPNVGKSTLLNRLAGRAVAITADVAGTTRDAVSARVLLDGLAVDLFDLPGERDDAGELEAQAIELSRPILREADLVLALVDPDSPEPPLLARRVDLVVANKSDLRTASEHLAISATTGQGIEALATTLRAMLVPDDALENERPWLFHQSIVASESDN